MYQSLEGFLSNEEVKYNESVSTEEVELESDIASEGVRRDFRDPAPDKNIHLEASHYTKTITTSFCKRSKIVASSTRSTPFGTVFFRSQACRDHGVSCYENFFIFHPAHWLIWLGMQSSLDILMSKSICGWKIDLSSRIFRAVPENALIFELCKRGNVEGVKILFKRGDASVMDRDPNGKTPLHVSIILHVYLPSHQLKTSTVLFEYKQILVQSLQE